MYNLYLPIVNNHLNTKLLMKITLAKALKLKNRKVTEINRIKEVLKRENSRLTTSTSTVKCPELYASLKDATNSLIALKAAIATANVGIYSRLAQMEECKDRITFIRELNTVEGDVKHPRYMPNEAAEKDVFVAFINNERRDSEIAALEARIGELQDEVDEFNATTKIDI